MATAKALDAKLGGILKPITMHWSGCPAGCGNHLVADIGLLGKKAKVGGRVVDAVGCVRRWPFRSRSQAGSEAAGRCSVCFSRVRAGRNRPVMAPARRCIVLVL